MIHQLRALLAPFLAPFLTSSRARRLLPALLALAAAGALFANNVVLAPDRALAAQALALADRTRADDATLRQWLRELNNPAPRAADAAPARNELLRKLNAIAQQADVHLVRIAPQSDNRGLVEIELASRFPNLIQFIGQLEARGGVLHHLQVHPGKGDGPAASMAASPIAITLRLEWPGSSGDPPLSPSLARRLADAAAAPDPFRPLPDRSGTTLRFGHFLSGITRTDEETFATIDGQDYRVGDPVGNGTLTAIGEDAVQLSSGSAQSWLRLGVR